MRKISLNDDEKLIDLDVDRTGFYLSLVCQSDGGLYVSIHGKRCPVPDEWISHVVGARWLDSESCLLWAAGYPSEQYSSSVGLLRIGKSERPHLGVPYLLFTSKDFIICSDSEYTISNEMHFAIPRIFTIYNSRSYIPEFSFRDILDLRQERVNFNQIENGIIANKDGIFWFIADNTPEIWALFVHERKISRMPLGTGVNRILGLACIDRYCFAICSTGKELVARTFYASKEFFINERGVKSLQELVGNEFSPKQNFYVRGHDGSISFFNEREAINLPILIGQS